MRVRELVNEDSPSRGMIRKYGHGDCQHLATALHLLTGWPIKELWGLDIPWVDEDDPLRREHRGDIFLHAFVINPAGQVVDVRGVRPLDSVIAACLDPKQKYRHDLRDGKAWGPGEIFYRADLRRAFTLIFKHPEHFGLTGDLDGLRQKATTILAGWDKD